MRATAARRSRFLAVREKQIDHDRCDFLPSLAAQPFDGVAAAIHPLDFERAVACIDQRPSNGRGFRGIRQDNEYVPGQQGSPTSLWVHVRMRQAPWGSVCWRTEGAELCHTAVHHVGRSGIVSEDKQER